LVEIFSYNFRTEGGLKRLHLLYCRWHDFVVKINELNLNTLGFSSCRLCYRIAANWRNL